MTLFEQFIFTYFISVSALAGFSVLWRNWLGDHPDWNDWLRIHLGVIAKALTCGSCFTFWATLVFVFTLNPLGYFFMEIIPFRWPPWMLLYLIQWMSLGWGALFLRFLYVAIQEVVSMMVHRPHDHA